MASFDDLRQTLLDAESPKQSLDAVIDFLRASGIETELTAPLTNLSFALLDASEGRANSLLVRKRMESGADKKPVLDTLNFAAASAAVTILKDYGNWDLSKASSHVARELHIERQQLVEFRKNLMKGRCSPRAIIAYDSFIQDRRNMADALPDLDRTTVAEEAAKVILQQVKKLRNQKG